MDDEFLFADETDEDEDEKTRSNPWKLLIVDDEREVHDVTKLALEDFDFLGREIEFLHAYSAAEAKMVISKNRDIAMILLDVVMETDHAGLEFVEFVREELGDHFVRIILRTGQPGQAPERQVITRYDINDYKSKTELTQQKLFTVIHTGLSSYRDLRALDANRSGLRKVIDATAQLFEMESMEHFAQGVLEQLMAMLYLDRDCMVARTSSLAAQREHQSLQVVAATGRYEALIGQDARRALEGEDLERIELALAAHRQSTQSNIYVGYYEDRTGVEHIVYIDGDEPLGDSDREVINLFCRNVSIAEEYVRVLEAQKALDRA